MYNLYLYFCGELFIAEHVYSKSSFIDTATRSETCIASNAFSEVRYTFHWDSPRVYTIKIFQYSGSRFSNGRCSTFSPYAYDIVSELFFITVINGSLNNSSFYSYISHFIKSYRIKQEIAAFDEGCHKIWRHEGVILKAGLA